MTTDYNLSKLSLYRSFQREKRKGAYQEREHRGIFERRHRAVVVGKVNVLAVQETSGGRIIHPEIVVMPFWRPLRIAEKQDQENGRDQPQGFPVHGGYSSISFALRDVVKSAP